MGEGGCSIEHGLVLHLEVGLLLLGKVGMVLQGLVLNLGSEWRDPLVASVSHFVVVLQDEVDCLAH